jgi:hypothetical protein
MVLTLGRGGVAVAVAAAVVLLYRLVSLAFIVAIGWSLWLLTWRHDSHESAKATGTDGLATTIEETRHGEFAGRLPHLNPAGAELELIDRRRVAAHFLRRPNCGSRYVTPFRPTSEGRCHGNEYH